MTIKLEFKRQDAWIGAYWETRLDWVFERKTTHLWLCLLPMLPLHIVWQRRLVEKPQKDRSTQGGEA